jgi:hypothetical protein
MNVRVTIGRFWPAAGALALALAVSAVQAQRSGKALHFTTTEYYEAPHQQQVKTVLSGAEAVPQAGGKLIIKQLKLQTFALDGTPEIVVTAPECNYDAQEGTAASAGPLQMQTGDGRFRVEGEGFLWRQTNSLLTISNQVRTVIEDGSRMKGRL